MTYVQFSPFPVQNIAPYIKTMTNMHDLQRYLIMNMWANEPGRHKHLHISKNLLNPEKVQKTSEEHKRIMNSLIFYGKATEISTRQ